MTSRKLLLSAAAAAAALAISAAGYGAAHLSADAAADLGLQSKTSPASTSTSTELASGRGDASVEVSTITQAQYADDVRGLGGCITKDGTTFCQAVARTNAYPTWNVYLDLGQATDLGGGRMVAESNFTVNQAAFPVTDAAGPYVQIHWDAPDYEIINGAVLSTAVTIDGTEYTYRCDVSQADWQGAWPQACSVDVPLAS